MLLVIGGFGTIGHLCIPSAQRLADASAVMLLDFLRLLWSVLIGVWFFSDIIDIWTLLGAGIIFGSSLYILIRESQLDKRNSVSTATASNSSS